MAVLALLLPGIAQALPQGYHYEMVSPPDKNDGDVGSGNFYGAYYASPDGERIAYNSLGGFGDAISNGVTGFYVAERGEQAWASTSVALEIAPSFFLTSSTVPAISRDASYALAGTTINPETGDPYPITPTTTGLHMFKVSAADQSRELFTTDDVDGSSDWALDSDAVHGNADFSRIVFEAAADLTGDGLPAGASRVFLRSDGGDTLLSVLPDGTATAGTLPAASFGTSYSLDNVVSADADVVFFNVPGPGADQGLYRRDVEAGTTDRVNADEHSTEDPPAAAATFNGASADGQIVYFATTQRLVDEDVDNDNDLYQYDQSKPAGERLTLVSADGEPADTNDGALGVGGVSADGKTIVFAARDQLVAGEDATTTTPKIYTWIEGELTYVTSTSSFPDSRSRLLSGNGELFAFSTSANIDGLNPSAIFQLYVLEVQTGEVTCVTCAAGTNTGQPILYRAPNTVGWVPNNRTRRAVSEEGHVFFSTFDALLPADTNGERDVYVWKDGELDLVSTGRSTSESLFVDASEDGSTVFFITREQLSRWDEDLRIDLYAARTGESLPEPPAPPAECEGDQCQASGIEPPPAAARPGSSDYAGAGNPVAGDEGRSCSPLQRKAKRFTKQAKRLNKRARKASGKKAKRLTRKAKKAKRKARGSKSRAQRCLARGER